MSQLEQNIRNSLKKKKILLVSHVVLGFPSFEIAEQSVDEMAKAGVEIIELQIPFSDPSADGPFFTMAQQEAVNKGVKVSQGFEFAEKITKKYPEINFLFMTYFNIVFLYGIEKFIKKASEVGIKGIILPDLPIEEADEYTKACEKYKVDPIFMFAPNTSEKRMQEINQKAKGFIYCQARVGVTGTHTKFSEKEKEYITRCRRNTNLPIAMGFGIQERDDVEFLENKVDIAICCTQAVKVLVQDGAKKMGDFLRKLRNN